MSGTIDYCKQQAFLLRSLCLYLVEPVKITGNDVFWIVQNKDIKEFFYSRQFRKNGLLNCLGIPDTGSDIFILQFKQVFLFTNFALGPYVEIQQINEHTGEYKGTQEPRRNL